MNLKNDGMKTVVITGASGGIGLELVKLFLQQKLQVIAVSRHTEVLKEIADPRLQVVVADINTESGRKAVAKVVEAQDTLDLLVNNAGAIVNKPFVEISPEELETVYRANVFAPYHLMQTLLPFMGKKTKAHVVNIGSMGGFQGTVKFAGLTAYSSSKFALAGLTEILAEEFKEKNIAFNCLALGTAQTKMLEEAFPGYKAPVSAAEMASFIVDFALKSHYFINGKIIPVSLSTT
jgi:NAD(P)-dependent dehydrogenase (short-subunit alcohol dehydrogenase family)